MDEKDDDQWRLGCAAAMVVVLLVLDVLAAAIAAWVRYR